MFSLRPATDDDLEAMMRIGHEGLRPHVETVRGWDQTLEEQGFREHFVPDLIRVVMVGEEAVGYIKVERFSDHIYLDGIYLASAWRGQGIGAAVMCRVVLKEATVPVRLRVYQTNPAKRLYQRLGFQVVQETTEAAIMEYVPKDSMRVNTCDHADD